MCMIPLNITSILAYMFFQRTYLSEWSWWKFLKWLSVIGIKFLLHRSWPWGPLLFSLYKCIYVKIPAVDIYKFVDTLVEIITCWDISWCPPHSHLGILKHLVKIPWSPSPLKAWHVSRPHGVPHHSDKKT